MSEHSIPSIWRFTGNASSASLCAGGRSQAVLDAWHDYHAHLNLPPERRPQNDAEQRDWTGRGDELFTNLLDRLATATNFKFDRDQKRAATPRKRIARLN